jgi:hypothetical protein
MEGLIVGIDLCDTYTKINGLDEDKTWTLPTVICRSKTAEEWYIGEEAYAHTLQGDGIIVDKLVKLAKKDGTATLGDKKYEAKELLTQFLKEILDLPKREYANEEIRSLVISVRCLDAKVIEVLNDCTRALGIPEEHVKIISHAEAFVYYIMSQKKEVWSGAVGMFDLSEEGLRYYEMKVQRGLKKTSVLAEYEEMEEGFNLDILETVTGAHLADKILTSCAGRVMQKKLYSSIFLSGRGFENRDWANEFMKKIAVSRRLYLESALFATGAAYRAMDLVQEKSAYPFVCICDGRLKTTVSMSVSHKGQDTSVVLASAGDSWYERRAVLDVIPENQNYIEFVLTPVDVRKKKLVTIPLEGFPTRSDRTMKVRVLVTFIDGCTMDVRLKDQGFGELFPSSGVQIRQEVMI